MRLMHKHRCNRSDFFYESIDAGESPKECQCRASRPFVPPSEFLLSVAREWINKHAELDVVAYHTGLTMHVVEVLAEVEEHPDGFCDVECNLGSETQKKVAEMHANGIRPMEIAHTLGVTYGTILQWLRIRVQKKAK